MLGDVINGVIGPIFDTTWNSLKAQYHQGLQETELKQKRIKAQQAIDRASAKYHQNYLDRHCNIKILPGLMKEGMPLATIYTAVKFLNDQDLGYFSPNLDVLEEQYRQTNKRRFRVSDNKRQDGLDVANQTQYLMVLGGPGVGKSTFLRKLGLDALEGRLTYRLMPVFIELKSFRNEDTSLLEVITKELQISGFPYSENLVESMLVEGKMLILLDGLDEVSSKQVNLVIEQIKDFCDQYNQNHFVASCRNAAYKGGFNRFTDVMMAEFDDAQIEQFVQRWFSSELDMQSETAQKFWGLLQQPDNASAKELAQTPLLLTFLCLVYDRSQSLPPVRSDLYGKALDILLEDWAAEKRLERDFIYQGLHTGLEKVLLSQIAYQSFKDDQLFFSEQGITNRIAEFLADTLDAPKHLDGAAVLNAIEVQQGILVEQATNAYSFSHLTLQEYLTARYISRNNLMQNLVKDHLTDERWREIFLLVSGLLEERSKELWVLIEQQANTFVSSLKLQDLLQWVRGLSRQSQPSNQMLASRALILGSAIAIGKSSNSANAIAPESAIVIAKEIAKVIAKVSKREIDITDNNDNLKIPIKTLIRYLNANAIAIIIANDGEMDSLFSSNSVISTINGVSVSPIALAIGNDSDDASTIAIAIDSTIAVASDIEIDTLSKKLEDLKKRIPSKEAKFGEWQNFAEQLIETYLTFFHLKKELVDFSLTEAKALEKYLYSVKLIIDCKNAAVRVSRKEWEAIESRLLTVPQDN